MLKNRLDFRFGGGGGGLATGVSTLLTGGWNGGGIGGSGFTLVDFLGFFCRGSGLRKRPYVKGSSPPNDCSSSIGMEGVFGLQ